MSTIIFDRIDGNVSQNEIYGEKAGREGKMEKKIAMALRRLADRIDGHCFMWSVEYIKTHPGLTAAEMREILGKPVVTTKP
jgi:hypothetical protein